MDSFRKLLETESSLNAYFFTFQKVKLNFSLHMQENQNMHYMHYDTKSTQVKIILGHNYVSTIGLKSWPVPHQHLV